VQLPRVVAWLPLLLLFLSFCSLIFAIITVEDRFKIFIFYLFWLLGLGAVGAIAFVGVNAISIQSDVTFDITNRRLLAMRIVLGALFGAMLTLPWGFDSFILFCKSIAKATDESNNARAATTSITTEESKALTFGAVMLLLPFILGFSTSLVILILNRLVEGVGIFFGERRRPEPPPAPARTSGSSETSGSRENLQLQRETPPERSPP
jgi:hypothetical protein